MFAWFEVTRFSWLRLFNSTRFYVFKFPVKNLTIFLTLNPELLGFKKVIYMMDDTEMYKPKGSLVFLDTN